MTKKEKVRKIRELCIELGICSVCKINEKQTTSMCDRCRSTHVKYQKKYRNMDNHCSRCGCIKTVDKYKTCERCRKHNKIIKNK